MAGIKIARGTDPFKKYWWVILVAFGAVGGWICLPALQSGGGAASSGGSAEAGLKTADQSLDSADNPAGAPGSALDMPGAPKKADAQGLASSLYQAPGGGVALSTEAASTGPTFADALKDITRASAARASAAASSSGGWNEAPQRGFTAPKANFGSMSGFGGGSASGASMSAGSSGGSAVSGFGGGGPNTGVAFAKGLQGEDKGEPGVKSVMHSLENARSASIAAATAGSADVAKGAGGSSFDGNAGVGRVSGGGASVGATGGVYGKLDSAPINLKANNPNLNTAKITPPPMPAPKMAAGNPMQQMIMQLLMGIAMAGVMALV